MLYITTSGYNYSYKRCMRIVKWFIEKHLPNHKITVNVEHKGLARENIFAWIWPSDNDYRPREFEIEIHNRMDAQKYTETLLHELWHLYQHVRGDLKDKRGKRLWKGIDHSKTDYSDQPWEVEAIKMEEILYREYIREQGFVL